MTAPSGPVSEAIELLRQTLGASDTFRTLVGAANQTEAEASIHKGALPKPVSGAYSHSLAELATLRPYAILFEQPEEGFQVRAAALSGSRDFVASGQFGILLEWPIPSNISDDPAEIAIQFRNIYGGIIDDMAGLASVAGYLDINEMAAEDGPWRSHEDDLETYGDVKIMMLRISWGIQQ